MITQNVQRQLTEFGEGRPSDDDSLTAHVAYLRYTEGNIDLAAQMLSGEDAIREVAHTQRHFGQQVDAMRGLFVTNRKGIITMPTAKGDEGLVPPPARVERVR